MKARTWFFAQGQSHEARGIPYRAAVFAMRLNSVPYWAQRAYAAGRLSVTLPRVTIAKGAGRAALQEHVYGARVAQPEPAVGAPLA